MMYGNVQVHFNIDSDLPKPLNTPELFQRVSGKLIDMFLHHPPPFSFRDEPSMVITNYITFGEWNGCNNTCIEQKERLSHGSSIKVLLMY